MKIIVIILLALIAVWLDIALSFWWVNWFIPIFVWVGIYYFVLKNNVADRWLWIIALSVWSLFSTDIFSTLIFIVLFGISGELLNLIYKKYLPMSNILLLLIPSAILLGIDEVILMLSLHQPIGWQVLGRIASTLVIIAFISFFYDQKKENKKYI